MAEIVRQLDGLPLAIELAAARLKLFPPRVMVGRLAQRFDFLKRGRRDLPDRQHTLRSTLDAAAEVCVGEDGLAAMWYRSLSGVRLPPAA